MIDIDSFNRSLKAIWIKKYLDTENQGGWKSFFDIELRKYEGVVTLIGNLNKQDTCILKVSDPFFKEILEIWSENFRTNGSVRGQLSFIPSMLQLPDKNSKQTSFL